MPIHCTTNCPYRCLYVYFVVVAFFLLFHWLLQKLTYRFNYGAAEWGSFSLCLVSHRRMCVYELVSVFVCVRWIFSVCIMHTTFNGTVFLLCVSLLLTSSASFFYFTHSHKYFVTVFVVSRSKCKYVCMYAYEKDHIHNKHGKRHRIEKKKTSTHITNQKTNITISDLSNSFSLALKCFLFMIATTKYFHVIRIIFLK